MKGLSDEVLTEKYESARSDGLFEGETGGALQDRFNALLEKRFRERYSHIPGPLWEHVRPPDWAALLVASGGKGELRAASSLSLRDLISDPDQPAEGVTGPSAARYETRGQAVYVPPDDATVLGRPLRFPAVRYIPPPPGRSAAETIEELLGRDQGKTVRLGEPLGGGGMRWVYKHPLDAGRVIKIYDPGLIQKIVEKGEFKIPGPVLTAYFIQRELGVQDFLQNLRLEFTRRQSPPPYKISAIVPDPALIERGVMLQPFVKGISVWKKLPGRLTLERLRNMDRFFELHELVDKALYRAVFKRFDFRLNTQIVVDGPRVEAGLDMGANWSNFFLDEAGVPILIDW